MKLYLDLETHSEVPIKHGTHAYAEQVEILIFAYAIDDGEIKVIDFTAGEEIPQEVYDVLEKDDTICVAHNSHFDRTVLRYSKYANLFPPVERWRDTMVRALAHSLPGGLGKLSIAFRLPVDEAKDKEGKALIQLFCKPRPKNMKLRRATRDTHPKEWQSFVDYARLDIAAMRRIDALLPQWNYTERAGDLPLWHLDQHINDRGFRADVELAQAAIRTVEEKQGSLRGRTSEITSGEVDSPTRRDKMLKFILKAYGVDLPDMKASTLERRVQDNDLPLELRELLAIRLAATTSSTSKYKALLRSVSSDGRLRNTLKFCGASRTGRWSGQLFQPQNLPRPKLDAEAIEIGIDILKSGAAELFYTNTMDIMRDALRGVIVASPGMKIVAADLSNIEGRDQAWLAGQDWKIKAFTAFDLGDGDDLYKLAYAKSFNVPVHLVTKAQRQVGKVQELALGYEGGVGAFVTFCLAYGIDMDELASGVLPNLPVDVAEASAKSWKWAAKQERTFGISREAYVACDALKKMWRTAHNNIEGIWKELDEAARFCIDNEGREVSVGKHLQIVRNKNWLRIVLPSGRSLCYPSPRIEDSKISYMGMHQYTRNWQRIYTYGGKLFENVCQAVACDVMRANMPRIEAAGYKIVLTVHDEVITEAPNNSKFNAGHLSSLLATNPSWAPDMPLAAGGFEGKRYRKDG